MSNEQIQNILLAVLMILLIVIFVLSIVFLILRMKEKNKKKDNNLSIDKKEKVLNGYTKESIYKFMEFDKIEDNMIIQKNGARFLMIIQCQGVNYDLMSMVEKNAVEEGFLQFLNTLRHPVQIYIQTRTVNLENSIENYKNKVNEVEINLNKKELEYQQNVRSGQYSEQDLKKEFYEITKQRNLYEYGKDIIYNTQMMSLNKNVLNKQYYIIVPYYPSELGNNDYDKDEIKNIAFSELYTRSQSIIRALSSCEVEGHILDSNGVTDLLYVAYNRDESEIYGLDKALAAGFDELYSTAPDVLDKKIQLLDQKIEKEALQKAKTVINEIKSEKQKTYEQKKETLDDLIDEYAKLILDSNESTIGKTTAKKAKDKIDEQTKKRRTTKTEKKETQKKEAEQDEKEETVNVRTRKNA